jgi:hypothetical protein
VRRIAAIALIALTVGACAPRLSFSNEAGGVIDKSGSIGNDRAYAMMTAACARYGKLPRIGHRDILTNKLYFDCVPKAVT